MCEWYLTGKKMCVNYTFVYLPEQINLVICMEIYQV